MPEVVLVVETGCIQGATGLYIYVCVCVCLCVGVYVVYRVCVPCSL